MPTNIKPHNLRKHHLPEAPAITHFPTSRNWNWPEQVTEIVSQNVATGQGNNNRIVLSKVNCGPASRVTYICLVKASVRGGKKILSERKFWLDIKWCTPPFHCSKGWKCRLTLQRVQGSTADLHVSCWQQNKNPELQPYEKSMTSGLFPQCKFLLSLLFQIHKKCFREALSLLTYFFNLHYLCKNALAISLLWW